MFHDLNNDIVGAKQTIHSFKELLHEAGTLGFFAFFLLFCIIYIFSQKIRSVFNNAVVFLINTLHLVANKEKYIFWNDKTIQELKEKDLEIKELKERIK